MKFTGCPLDWAAERGGEGGANYQDLFQVHAGPVSTDLHFQREGEATTLSSLRRHESAATLLFKDELKIKRGRESWNIWGTRPFVSSSDNFPPFILFSVIFAVIVCAFRHLSVEENRGDENWAPAIRSKSTSFQIETKFAYFRHQTWIACKVGLHVRQIALKSIIYL